MATAVVEVLQLATQSLKPCEASPVVLQHLPLLEWMLKVQLDSLVMQSKCTATAASLSPPSYSPRWRDSLWAEPAVARDGGWLLPSSGLRNTCQN